MNSMLFSLVVAGVLAQQQVTPKVDPPAAPAAQETPVSSNLKLRIATSTYLADGRVLTASAGNWPLAINKAVTAYAIVGRNMCEPRAATLEPPSAMPVPGWQLEFTPVREAAGELEVRVQWRQLGLASKETFSRTGFGTATTLTLHAGDRVIADYISAQNMTGLAGSYRVEMRETTIAPKTRVAPGDGYWVAFQKAKGDCDAIGMSLEIGLDAAKTDAIVEAELWLVRPNRDGTEKSERQVLRLPIGQPASNYYFDEARLIALPSSLQSSPYYAKVSGELAAFAVENGKIHFNFKVSRRYDVKQPNADTTSTYRDLIAEPGEVLAFQLPLMEMPVLTTTLTPGRPTSKLETRALAPLSVRLRAQVLK